MALGQAGWTRWRWDSGKLLPKNQTGYRREADRRYLHSQRVERPSDHRCLSKRTGGQESRLKIFRTNTTGLFPRSRLSIVRVPVSRDVAGDSPGHRFLVRISKIRETTRDIIRDSFKGRCRSATASSRGTSVARQILSLLENYGLSAG